MVNEEVTLCDARKHVEVKVLIQFGISETSRP